MPPRSRAGPRFRGGRTAATLPRLQNSSPTSSVSDELPRVFSSGSHDQFFGGDVQLVTGVYSAQGRRPYQEDEYAIRPYLREGKNSGCNQDTHFFGIFDGHAGGRCSETISRTVPEFFAQDPSFDTNIGAALTRSFHNANDDFLRLAERLKLHDGSTGCAAVLRGMGITLANVGDCRAVLVKHGNCRQLTTDHKPTDPEEQKRIASLGGTVVYCMGVARVQGILAVSRAFGNRSIKHVIRPDPDIFNIKLSPDDDYLVQASDGLWDVLRNRDVLDICYNMEPGGPQKIAEELVHAALARGSTDNTTAIVVSLRSYIAAQLSCRGGVSRGGGGSGSPKSENGHSASTGNANSLSTILSGGIGGSGDGFLSKLFSGPSLTASTPSPSSILGRLRSTSDNGIDAEVSGINGRGGIHGQGQNSNGSPLMNFMWLRGGGGSPKNGEGGHSPSGPLHSPIQREFKRPMTTATTRPHMQRTSPQRLAHSPITVQEQFGSPTVVARRPKTRGHTYN